MAYLLPFADPRTGDVALAGGKGASLSRLYRGGFPVPEGVIVGTAAYHELVAPALRMPCVRQALERVHADEPASSQSGSDAMQRVLAALPMPSRLAAEIARWCGDGAARQAATRWAVRSSGTLEDTASAAFAGQHDTFLNCAGLADVLAHVRACWLSLWSPRAIAYRARLGLPQAEAAMAVVLQQMVDCEVAGVAFSIDPVTGELGRVVIDGNFGLGESVVSGEMPVDHYAVEKGSGRVVHRQVAVKARRVVVAAARGTVEQEVSAQAAARPALCDARAGAVAALVERVEAHAQWPVDVEWGIVNDRVVLLQARPITTIPPRWTRDESAERFPNVVTPLTWDFVERGFHRSLAHSLCLMGLPALEGQWFACFGHYVYGNQNAVELYARRMPMRVEALHSLADLDAQLPALVERFRWVTTLPEEWHRALPAYLDAVAALDAEPIDRYDVAALWEYVRRVDDVGIAYFLPNIAISIGHGLLHRALNALLAAAMGPAEAERAMPLLLACETTTTRVNRGLQALATRAGREPSLRSRLVCTPSRVLWKREGDLPAPFWSAFRAFIAEHGHRETDFDAYHPTWGEAPWVVLDHVRLLVEGSGGAMPPQAGGSASESDRLAIDRAKAECRVLARLPEALRPFGASLIRLAREYTVLDDLEHYHTTRLSRPMRRGVRAIGARLVRHRLADDASDAFFARRATLERAITEHTPEAWRVLAEEIRTARSSYEGARVASPAWALGEPEAAATDVSTAGCLRGTPGSPGAAEGEVYVIHGVEDFADFPKGAVLVARATNPAWTPLFFSACAVVTESGGVLSHGAVTAREMHLPAVMAVRGVVGALANGDRVRVDGTRGLVLRLTGT